MVLTTAVNKNEKGRVNSDPCLCCQKILKPLARAIYASLNVHAKNIF